MIVDIIGGGIGGLTMAISLEQKGIKARVFEQAKELQFVGAGIILANNAMQVYKKLGLQTIIEKNGHSISSLNVTKANLKILSKVNLSSFEQKHAVQSIAIHRGVLQQILIDALKETPVYLDYRLKKISEEAGNYTLEFTNGKRISSTILIGADGIHSKVRDNLFYSHKVRYANQICWRGITEYSLPKDYQNELNEAWGNKTRFGFVQIADNKVYWYALKSYKNHKEEFQLHNIEAYFKDYHTIVKDIISSSDLKEVHTAPITDLEPMNKWFHENVCLIGDAAHATTPNMGQGACQAIEDGYVLATCLHNFEAKEAFKEFQKLRLSKAHNIVNTSWKIGKVSHIANPILVSVRNAIMKCTPSSIQKKQLALIFKIAEV